MTYKDMVYIKKLVKEKPATIEEMKNLSLIAFIAERIGEYEMSERAKLIISETLSTMN